MFTDQYQHLIWELAEQRRQNAIQERDGTVYKVWAQNGEQKVQIQIGVRQDGSPWLSPWLHTHDHRGSHRTEVKYHEGMNVKVSNIAGDMRNATVRPSAENNNHQRPDHASDNFETYQYVNWREQRGSAHKKTFLVNNSSSGGSSNSALSADASSSDGQTVVRVEHGSPPSPQNQGQPWNGPDPKQSDQVQQRIHHEVGDKSQGQQGVASTTITPQAITHKVGNTAALTITNNNVSAIVGGGGMMSPEMLSGMFGPMNSIIADVLGSMISPSMLASMSSAAMGAVTGAAGAGASISTSSMPNLSDEITWLIEQVVGGILSAQQITTLTTSLVGEVTDLLGESYTVSSESPSVLATSLQTEITLQAGESIDPDDIANLANVVANYVLTQSILNASTASTTGGIEMTPENTASIMSGISSALTSAGGGTSALSGLGISPAMIGNLSSMLSNQVAGLSGGSVWSLMPNIFNHLTQAGLNMKSVSGGINKSASGNIAHTADGNITHTAQGDIDHTAQGNLSQMINGNITHQSTTGNIVHQALAGVFNIIGKRDINFNGGGPVSPPFTVSPPS